ncbi:hypothetical protein [Sphingopyxis sp. FD7]|jgi:hypothetical protein|uniref:hypothetical protein n=1 Tax=Sphingopyxis sp. FD7 TaxID=1914525 RepID=UPI000DC63B41|nr:hypothetical protein [Sphingopyxis sp. FD7]BBB12190.1 hypothetical protein SPYCA_1448 [Sphingopyxis sp. FD7]
MASLSKRLLWHVNRSPLKHGVKAVMQLAGQGDLPRRMRLARQLPVDERTERIAIDFERDGFVMLGDYIPEVQRSRLRDVTDDLIAAEKASERIFADTKSGLWSHLVERAMENGQLPSGHFYAQFALQDEIIRLVTRLFGVVPRLDYVTVTHSAPMVGEPTYSQLWHRDHDDVKVIKLFVYLTDVNTVEDGPFSFLPGPCSDRIGFSFKSHRRDDQMPRAVNIIDARREILGPRLTCFMVETSRCLHMGSRVAAGHERLMYTATYFAPPRVFPEPTRTFFRVDNAADEIERAFLTP